MTKKTTQLNKELTKFNMWLFKKYGLTIGNLVDIAITGDLTKIADLIERMKQEKEAKARS